MRKCVRGGHVKHLVFVQRFHETEITDAHSGLSDTCMLCSQNMYALIGRFDWNRPPIAKLEHHNPQNGCETLHTDCKRIDVVHAAFCVYRCIIKCFVLISVASPV